MPIPNQLRRFALVFFAAAAFAAPALRGLDAPDDDNDYQIPEGFEERRYPIASLISRPQNFRLGGTSFHVGEVATLSDQNVMDIVRNCVAPDSWTKRGSARMELSGAYLTVLQKKEVHAEIEKVLQWLQDGVAPPFRATIVAVTLKTETARKLSAAASVPSADLLKLMEEAGEGGAEIVELRGVEGQQVAAVAGQQQTYIKDFDVSGAVYDPVIATAQTGLLASAVAYRNPECSTVQIDLSVGTRKKADFEKAKMSLDGAVAGKAALQVKEVKKDDKGKPIDTPEQRVPAHGNAFDFKADLTMELPSQNFGGLDTSLSAPQGTFVPAGTIDFSLTGENAGKLTVVFVRATVGASTVPTLVGVSGLKEGESYRLYPLAAGSRRMPDFGMAATAYDSLFPQGLIAVGAAATGAIADPFAGPPVPVPMSVELRFGETISKAKKLFTEKVRKNKLVEDMGPVLFTRLVDADHAKILKNLTDDNQRQATPATMHALAVAVPQAAYRKMLLADSAVFEAADVDALAGNGAQVLVDTSLKLLPWQIANVTAGRQRFVISDYEISGDSYDPVVRPLLETSYAATFKFRRGAGAGGTELEVRFSTVPAKIAVERSVLDTFSLNSGAEMAILMGLHADLDKYKSTALSIRGTSQVPAGKYILAGSAQMPPKLDGAPDPRQALLFVRATE